LPSLPTIFDYYNITVAINYCNHRRHPSPPPHNCRHCHRRRHPSPQSLLSPSIIFITIPPPSIIAIAVHSRQLLFPSPPLTSNHNCHRCPPTLIITTSPLPSIIAITVATRCHFAATLTIAIVAAPLAIPLTVATIPAVTINYFHRRPPTINYYHRRRPPSIITSSTLTSIITTSLSPPVPTPGHSQRHCHHPPP
jgi:hypothetical protein